MEPEKKSNGALVGLVVIVIVLVIGGIYVFMSNQENMKLENLNDAEIEASITDQDASVLNSLEEDSTTLDVNVNENIDSVE